MTPDFPERVYTIDEVEKARELVESGYKHEIAVSGSSLFKKKVEVSLSYIKTAGFYDFFRTYIREIVEINGFSQLRETEVAVWANMQLLENQIEAAGFFVQKASQMQEFLEGKEYYGGAAEARSVTIRIKFLKALKLKSKENSVKNECEKMLKKWDESTFVF